jgi:hypothetical protein
MVVIRFRRCKKKDEVTQRKIEVLYHRMNLHHPIHEEYCIQCNLYSEIICKAKAEHWVEWLEGLDKSSVWQANSLVTAPATEAGRVRIPTLQVKDPVMKQVTKDAADNARKGHLFYNTFFPPANPALTPPPVNFRYSPPCWSFQNITNEQVHQAIKKMKPYKASRLGTVSNLVLVHAREELVPHLSLLFCATNTLKYYPQEWSLTKMLILKKPVKPDYTSPSEW